MMGNYSAYTDYKDSGVEWLGEIPEHWEIYKVTHGFKNIGSGTTPKSDNSNFYDGDIPWITTSELRETLIEDTSQKITQEALKVYSALKVYPKDSIAIAMYGATIGRLGILGIDATVNQACCVFSESEVFYLPFFYYWLWMHRPNLIALSAGGGQPNLSQDDLKQLRLATPPLDEQKAIAAFLDYKTQQIDQLIAKKESLLEKLDEKRTALISHAVTKGLDPTVPMEDSGVEWLGEIPEHWETKKIQYIGRLKSGENIISQQIEPDGLYPVFGGNGIRGYFDSYNHDGHYILIGRQGALCGNINYANGKFWASEHAVVVNPLVRFEVFWLGELLKIMNLNQYSTSAAQPGLSVEQIARLKIPFPPFNEQKVIAQYLSKKTVEIDRQKVKILQAIEVLKEYRTALITNAVTGKIDVCSVPILTH